jgi:hypothetical protein
MSGSKNVIKNVSQWLIFFEPIMINQRGAIEAEQLGK